MSKKWDVRKFTNKIRALLRTNWVEIQKQQKSHFKFESSRGQMQNQELQAYIEQTILTIFSIQLRRANYLHYPQYHQYPAIYVVQTRSVSKYVKRTISTTSISNYVNLRQMNLAKKVLPSVPDVAVQHTLYAFTHLQYILGMCCMSTFVVNPCTHTRTRIRTCHSIVVSIRGSLICKNMASVYLVYGYTPRRQNFIR